MKILLVSTEVFPFAKVGGLADVTSYLAREWSKKGHEVVTVLPMYRGYGTGFEDTGLTLRIPLGHQAETAKIYNGKFPESDARVFLLENKSLYERDSIYGSPENYKDNDKRFVFLSKAVFEVAKAIDFQPDIIHAHDFQTAFTMAYLKTVYRNDDFFRNTAGVLTIHNLAFQGKYNPWRVMDFSGLGMKEFFPGSWFEHEGSVNMLKTGIMFADKITTVSPNYSEEIKLAYYSEGLQDVIGMRQNSISGVLNGVYFADWNPITDRYIHKKYGPDTLSHKEANKTAFLKEHGHEAVNKPLLGFISRLTEQKGIDIMKESLERHLKNKSVFLAVLGVGDAVYEDYFHDLARKYPGNTIIRTEFDEPLAHKIIAASDFILVPSRFEPCGLTQMYGLKYGSVPVVHSTGGLKDTVTEYDPAKQSGTGFLFRDYNADEFHSCLERALSLYDSEPHWTGIRLNGMKEDNSSERSAERYVNVFRTAIESIT